MTIRVYFEISRKDLKRFRDEMRRARKAVEAAEEEDILNGARQVCEEIAGGDTPDFVRDRVPALQSLIAMVDDDEWRMPKGARGKVLSALVYLCDPDDLIPDVVPGLGLLDDAIMIELVLRDLRHDIEAYRDFCDYRDSYYRRHKIGRDAYSRQLRLERKRRDLLERAVRRKKKERDGARTGGAPQLV